MRRLPAYFDNPDIPADFQPILLENACKQTKNVHPYTLSYAVLFYREKDQKPFTRLV